jgi:hypothetical protein
MIIFRTHTKLKNIQIIYYTVIFKLTARYSQSQFATADGNNIKPNTLKKYKKKNKKKKNTVCVWEKKTNQSMFS